MKDDRLKRIDGEELIRATMNEDSIKLMKLLERSEIDAWNPYQIDRYAVAIVFFLIISLSICYYNGLNHDEEGNGYHKEILTSRALSCIVDGRLIELADGNYPVAMSPYNAGMTIAGRDTFPMFLVLTPNSRLKLSKADSMDHVVDDRSDTFHLYPLNIEDDSLLPRQGRTLPLHILIGFTSEHAESTLKYDEKVHDSPEEDYRRKAFYYLEVSDGYGRMRRGYMSTENAGDAVKWYRDTDHFRYEMLASYYVTNGARATDVENLVEGSIIK